MVKTKERQEIEDEALARAFIEEGFNGTRALLKVKNNSIKVESARAEAPAKLARPNVRAKIVELLNEKGFGDDEQARILSRNAKQRESYSASNQAIEIAQKIKADYYSKQPINAIQFNLGNLFDEALEEENDLP